MSIPTNYQNLSGFRTSYSESELRLAIAIAEAFIANNLGGGGGSGGASQAQVQAAIEAASNLDGVEPTLTAIDGKIPALGQALASASVPVVLPASQLTTLTPPEATRLLGADGSTQATVKAGNTGFAITDTALVTTSRDLPLELSGSGSSVGTIVPSTNISGYQSGSLQLSGTFNAAIVLECSNDNTNWVRIPFQLISSTTPSVDVNISVAGVYDFRLNYRFLRVRIAGYTSGTVTATLVINKFPSSLTGFSNGSFSIFGTVTTSLSSVTTRSQQYTQGTISSSGDTTIIAAPGSGLFIHVTSLIIQLEGSTATTVLIKDGASTTRKRILLQNQGDALVKDWAPGQEFRLSVNTAFVLNLSGANTIGYSVEYYLA